MTLTRKPIGYTEDMLGCRGVALLTVLAIVATGCAVAGNASVPDQESVVVGGQAGNRAPAFAVTTLDGREVTLTSLRGKPLLLHFFATW